MPLLAAFLGNLLAGIAGFFAQWFSKKVATGLAATTAIIASLAALTLAFNQAIAPLVAAAFNTAYGQVIGLAFPPVAGTCIATYIGAVITVKTYRLQTQITDHLTKAT